jgi:hypothetical protein
MNSNVYEREEGKGMTEEWVVLNDLERNYGWDKIIHDFSFKSRWEDETFAFTVPYDMYDISKNNLVYENDALNALMVSIFIECRACCKSRLLRTFGSMHRLLQFLRLKPAD